MMMNHKHVIDMLALAQAHLQKLELIDMDLFTHAVETPGNAAKPVTAQAVAGAQGLTELTALIEG